jgi:hypothetical protein
MDATEAFVTRYYIGISRFDGKQWYNLYYVVPNLRAAMMNANNERQRPPE